MSPKRSDQHFFMDMLTAIRDVQEYVSGCTYENSLYDKKSRDAVVRNFDILGTATNRIVISLRTNYPDVEWKAIADFRDKLAHDYFGVNYENVCQNNLDKLPNQLKRISEIAVTQWQYNNANT